MLYLRHHKRKEVFLIGRKNRFKNFVKRHKEEIIIAGIAITAGVGGVLLAKNLDALKETIKPISTPTVIPKSIPTEAVVITKKPMLKIIDVKEHLRTLPTGYHASAHKIQEAAENGIALATNQTFVSSHSRCYAA